MIDNATALAYSVGIGAVILSIAGTSPDGCLAAAYREHIQDPISGTADCNGMDELGLTFGLTPFSGIVRDLCPV